MKSVEIITLVYKSKEWTKFIVDQMKEFGYAKDWMVQCRVVANDPEVKGLLDYPRSQGVGVSVYNDPNPEDYYINRVYRCWNWAGKTSPAEYICFVNSDMAFAPGWLDNLLRYAKEGLIPTSRLVESGKIPSGLHALVQNFGRTPQTFDMEGWLEYAIANAIDLYQYGGLYMPVVFKQKLFQGTGYPEGNLYEDGVGTLNGPVKASGDAYYFAALRHAFGMRHITVFNSMVYHVQEGEMDAPQSSAE